MASYLKPRRGYYSAISSTTLQSGEVYFETPNGIGGGAGKIMMGNGSSTYATLANNSKYFLDPGGITASYSKIDVNNSYSIQFRKMGERIVFVYYVGMLKNYVAGSNTLISLTSFPTSMVPSSYSTVRLSANMYANSKPTTMGLVTIDLSNKAVNVLAQSAGTVIQLDFYGMYLVY